MSVPVMVLLVALTFIAVFVGILFKAVYLPQVAQKRAREKFPAVFESCKKQIQQANTVIKSGGVSEITRSAFKQLSDDFALMDKQIQSADNTHTDWIFRLKQVENIAQSIERLHLEARGDVSHDKFKKQLGL
jgi:hypothetical protein